MIFTGGKKNTMFQKKILCVNIINIFEFNFFSKVIPSRAGLYYFGNGKHVKIMQKKKS